MVVKIVLDYGHGQGSDFNRGGLYFNEGDNNFAFGQDLKEELETYGFDVYETRPYKSQNPSWEDRATKFNYLNPDFYMSIHSNAGGGTGPEIFWRTGKPNPSNVLLDGLARATANCLDLPLRVPHIKSDDWAVLGYGNNATVKCLFEMFFHDNKDDSKKYLAKKDKLPKVMAKTIANYYGYTKATPTVAETEAEKVTNYQVTTSLFSDREKADSKVKELENKNISGFKVEEVNQRVDIDHPRFGWVGEYEANSDLLIRDKPNGEVIGTISKGEVYSMSAIEGAWLEFKYREGYVAKKFMTRKEG